MNTSNLSPQEQLNRIEEMVFKARMRFEENGFAFILWGTTISVASFAQAYLIHLEKYSISWYPYLLMPLVALFTFWYYAKKGRRERNPIDTVYSRLWIFTSINILLLAFLFNGFLRENLIAIILILSGVATIVSGSFIRSKLLLLSGIVLNLGGYSAFFLPWNQQPFLMGVLGVVAILAPGIFLAIKNKKQDV